jgi:hypothetical protein
MEGDGMKKIAVVLCLIMVTNLFFISSAKAATLKGGEITSNEVWSGEIELNSDVTIPQGKELTIEPGTVFLYDEDSTKTDATSPKLIVYGTLKVGQASGESEGFDLIPLDQNTRIIQVSPYSVDTKSLRDEFNAFRVQYVILWTVLTAALIYAVANRR